MLKNKKPARHYFNILLATLALFLIPFFTPLTSVIAQPAAPVSADEEKAAVQFGWEMNIAPDQVGNIQVLIDGQPIYNSNNPPPTNIVSFTYSPQRQHYTVLYHQAISPGNHDWQVKVFNQENQLISSTNPETFKVTDPNQAQGNTVTQTVSNYQDFMNTTTIGGHTIAEVSETSLLSLSAISALFYGAVLLIQVSYILPMGIFAQLLKALGFFKAGEEPKGFVFNSKTYEPIPFAVLTVSRVDENKSLEVDSNYVETIVSGTDGIYRGVNLPIGQYRLKVEREGFSFPTTHKRAPYLSQNDYYSGEVFNVTSTQVTQQMLVPMDAISSPEVVDGAPESEAEKISRKHRRQNRWQVISKAIVQILNKLMIVFWIFSVMVLIASPSNWVNWLIFGIYSLIIAFDLIKVVRRPRLKGLVTDENAQPLEGVLVRLSTVDANQLVAIVQTDKKGRYSFYVKKGVYQISAYQTGRILKKDTVFTLTEVDLTRKRLTNDIVMQVVSQDIDDYFNQSSTTSSESDVITKEENSQEEGEQEPPAYPEPTGDIEPPEDQLPDFNKPLDDGDYSRVEQSRVGEQNNVSSHKDKQDEIPSFDTAALLKSQFNKKD